MYMQPPVSRVASQPATLCAGQQAVADKEDPSPILFSCEGSCLSEAFSESSQHFIEQRV